MNTRDELENRAFHRRLWLGLGAWAAFCVVAVIVRGVRWEETYEHALIITRLAPYPEGHPDYRYLRNIISLQSYLSAGLLLFVRNGGVVCGVRNVLQLASAVMPVFLLGSLLTRRTRWGHASATLILLEPHIVFQSYYPIVVWPSMYSIGQIGAGYAILVLTLFAGGFWRSGWFLTGLMVAVHIGQLPVLLVVAGVQLSAILRTKQRSPTANPSSCSAACAAAWFGGGLSLCAAFWIVQQFFHAPAPLEGAYAATGDTQAVWAAYTRLHDIHRTFPRFNPFGHSTMAVIAAVLLVGAAAWRERRAPESHMTSESWLNRPYAWLWLYVAGVAFTVWTLMLVHGILGEAAPFLLIGWMPYRLTNHLPPILLIVSIAQLVSRAEGEAGPRGSALLLPIALLIAFFLPLFRFALPADFYTRYLATQEHLFFVLAGAAFVAAFKGLRGRPRFRVLWLFVVFAAFFWLAAYHQFGAACAGAGVVAAIVLEFITHGKARDRIFRAALGAPGVSALCVLLIGGLLYGQWRDREHLPTAPIQREITEYLAERGESQAMLLTPYWDAEWLCRTGHPVMADYQTAQRMTYMPALAPVIKKLHLDLYGYCVDVPDEGKLDVWPLRTREEWQRLGEEYGFSYVVSPNELPLRLDPILHGAQHTFYAIPSPASP